MAKRLVCYFLWIAGIQFTFAQTSNFMYFGIEDGLPQSGIYNILQDKKGNLWLGTMDGASKYNGKEFKNYNKNQGMAENWITASLLDTKGNIWFGHWTGGITYYDYVKDSLSIINTKDISKTINAICEDKSGNIWFGTEGMGLVNYCKSDSNDKKIVYFNVQDGLSSNNVSSVICDTNGIIWIATNKGLTKYNPSEKNNDKAIEYLTINNGLSSNNLSALLHDHLGNLWIGTKDKGLIHFNISTKKFQYYRSVEGLANDFIKTIYEDADHNILVGTYGGGISVINNDHISDYSINKIYSIKEGLCNNKILSLFQDREKNLWIGTLIGLNQLRTEQFEVVGTSQGLKNTLIWAIIPDELGNIWMGTENGLVKYNPKSGIDNNELTTYTVKDGLANNSIVALHEDNEGYIWTSTWGEGVCRLNKQNGKIERFNTNNGLPSNEVSTIISDHENNVWLGTDKGGLAKYNSNTKKFEVYTSTNGLGNDRIYTSYRDKNNNLWFGTLGGGITKFNGKNFYTYSSKNGLFHPFIICITEDNEGNILAGTYGGGIYKFDGTSFNSFQLSSKGRYFSPFLMLVDKDDNLWIGTSAELDKYNLKTKQLQQFNKEQGYLGFEVNPNAVCADKEGNIWFGSIFGAVKYCVQKNKINVIEPVIDLTNIQVNYKNAGLSLDPVFDYNQNQLTFHFMGVSLANPHNVRYQYQLQGFDKDWSPAVKETFVTYNNLSPGNYTFLVRSSNSDGVWNTEPATYNFRIRPPFWQRSWFKALSLIGMLALLYLIFKLRLKKIQREKQLLEKMVAERTAEVENQNIIITQKNKDITDSIIYARHIQDAILPNKNTISEYLKEFFILYKPRDIVSGDFYWFTKKKTNTNPICFIAAADCTGHGVPGAFMSMIGHTLLEEIVHEKNIVKPSMILSMLDNLLKVALKQNSAESGSKDGMDIALCALEFDIHTSQCISLEYAAALRPLYYIHNNEFNEILPDRFSVGGKHNDENKVFVNHKVNLSKGDTFYIFSDGFPDQFGESGGKKYMAKKFKTTLLSIQNLSMKEQEKILENEFNSWKGNLDQVDDVVVVGVKI